MNIMNIKVYDNYDNDKSTYDGIDVYDGNDLCGEIRV